MLANENSVKYWPNNFESRPAKRPLWGSKIEFYLACLGYGAFSPSAFILPHLIYSHGGIAFLLPFVFFLTLCGIPLFYLQTSLGQFSSKGFISVYNISPILKGFGYTTLLFNSVIAVIESISVIYPFWYLIITATDSTQWSTCNNAWNSRHCLEINNSTYEAYRNNTYSPYYDRFVTPAEEYFLISFLEIPTASFGTVLWKLLSLSAVTWIIIFVLNLKSIKWIGKILYFTIGVPFIILIAFLIRGALLPGAVYGIREYLMPDPNMLLSVHTWANAAIFSVSTLLGPGLGVLQNLASYNSFDNNLVVDSIAITAISIVLILLPGIFTFSFVGYQAYSAGISIGDLMISSFPYKIFLDIASNIPLSKVWIFLFFLAITLIALTTCILQVDSIILALTDEFSRLKKMRVRLLVGICALFFLFSIIFTLRAGVPLLELVKIFSGSLEQTIIQFCQLMIIVWSYGEVRLRKDITFMTTENVGSFWFILWKYITPIVLISILIADLYTSSIMYMHIKTEHLPEWILVLGWYMFCQPFMCIPIVIALQLIFSKGSLMTRIRHGFIPNNWFPAKTSDWERYDMLTPAEELRSVD